MKATLIEPAGNSAESGEFQHGLDNLLLLALLGLFREVLHESRSDVHGVDGTIGAHFFGKQERKQARAGADVRHRIAGLQPDGASNVVTFDVDVPRLALELFHELPDVRVGIGEVFVHLGRIRGWPLALGRILGTDNPRRHPQEASPNGNN